MPSRKRISTIAMGCVAFMTITNIAHADKNDPCVQNYTVKGSIFTGKTFATWQGFPEVSTTVAFKHVYAYLLKDGWKIGQADKELGVISVSKEIGSGQTDTLNILVESADKGSKVTSTLTLPAGAMASKGELQTIFCKLLTDAGK